MTPTSAVVNGKRYDIYNQWTMPYDIVYGLKLTNVKTATNHRVLYRKSQVKSIRYSYRLRASGNKPYNRKPPVRTRRRSAVAV